MPRSLSGGLDGKESACNAGDLGLIPGLGRYPEEGMASHSSISWRILMDRGAWRATVHRITKSQTRPINQAHSTRSLQGALHELLTNSYSCPLK